MFLYDCMRQLIIKFLLFNFFLTAGWTACSQNSILLNNSTVLYEPIEEISYFSDSTHTLTLENILEKSDNLFQVNHEKNIDLGLLDDAVWVKLDISNKSDTKNWILAIDYPLIKTADVYCVDIGGKIISNSSGLSIPYSKRSIKSRDLAFPLKIDSSAKVFIRLTSMMPMKIPLSIRSAENYYQKSSFQLAGYAIYYGIVCLFLLLNIFYFFYLKERTFLLYCFALASIALGLGSDNGLAFKYLWPETPLFNNYSNTLFAGAANLFMLLFVRKLLLSKVYCPAGDKIALLLQYVTIVFMLVALIHPHRFVVLTGGLLTLIGFPVFIWLGVRAWMADYKIARYYMLGWVGLALGVTIHICSFFAFIPNEIGSFGLYIGSILEATFFTISIGVRFKHLKSKEQEFTEKLEEYRKNRQKNENSEQNEPKELPKHMAALSKRETEVLSLIAIGLTDKEIAERLFISLTTVKAHARNIYSKLDVKNRTEAVAIAQKFDLI